MLADDPPVTASVLSLKLEANKVLTKDPAGFDASSLTAVNEAAPVANGASFTAVTVIESVAVTVAPLLSETVYVISGKVPFQLAAGVNV